MTITQQIRDFIETSAFGELITAVQLLERGLGKRAAIDQTLSRLHRAGLISRIGRGLYAKGRPTRFGARVLPNAEQIARAFAATRAEPALQPHGAEAARRLGLTTQMPAETTYLTRGSSRTLRIGQLRLRFEHAPAKHLLLAGRPAGTALSALFHLGRFEATLETIQHIRAHLPLEEWHALLGALSDLPKWLRTRLQRSQRAELHA
jgi:Family of unknown function (DUF6088)